MYKQKSPLLIGKKRFWRSVLSTKSHRSFYRKWQSIAVTNAKLSAWSAFRGDTFNVGVKSVQGTAIVSSLRKHLAEIQKGRCCYCRRWLQGIAHARPIEHVLSQKDYRQYTFIYQNLALACYNCNDIKKAKNWTSIPVGLKAYPKAEDFANFFHPRFHDYDSHVKFLHVQTNGTSVSVYVGITDQGRHLCLNLLKECAKRELVLAANDRLGNAIETLQGFAGDSHLMPVKFHEFFNLLNSRIQDLALAPG